MGNSVAKKKGFANEDLDEELGKNTIAFQWRDYDPAIARFNKIDRFAEKYQPISPYGFTASNPIYFREIAGDSLMLFKNGKYISTVDNGKDDITGFNQKSKVDKNGKETFTGAQSFSFNDLDSDMVALKNGDMELSFISSDQVDGAMKRSGVKKQNVFSRWSYASSESNKGKMDFKYDGIIKPTGLNIINGVGYNSADFGNYLWGNAMGRMGFTSVMARSAAHMNAWWSAKESNPGLKSDYPWTISWFMNRSWGGDGSGDQRAIQNGLNDSGSYWKAKKRSFKNL